MVSVNRHPAPPVRDTAIATRPAITLVTSEGCHWCEDTHADLDERAASGVLHLDVVPADSDRGRALLAEHRPQMFPLVLLDGVFFSSGRMPRRKLDRALASRGAVHGI